MARTKKPPGTSKGVNNSPMSAPETFGDSSYDRAVEISGMSRVTRDIEQAQKESKSTSRDIGSVAAKMRSKKQSEVQVQEMNTAKQSAEVLSSVNTILDKLKVAATALAKGTKDITVGTAKATKDFVSQYGRAVSEDISVNKQNVVGMALARSSPIFGYFAAKFVETNVFKSAMSRIKQSLVNAFSFLGNKIKGMFSRNKTPSGSGDQMADWDEDSKTGPQAAARRTRNRSASKKGQGGIDFTPVVTELQKIAEYIIAIKEVIKKELDGAFAWRGKVFDILTEFKIETLGFLTSYKTTFFKTFGNLPFVQSFMKLSRLGNTLFISPIKMLFRPRGGYYSKLPRGGNMFGNIQTTLGLIYTTTQPKLDDMVNYLKIMAESLTGKKQKGVKEEKWTMFGRLKDMSQGKNKEKWNKQTINDIIGRLGLDKDTLDQEGFTKKATNLISGKPIKAKADELISGAKTSAEGIGVTAQSKAAEFQELGIKTFKKIQESLTTQKGREKLKLKASDKLQDTTEKVKRAGEATSKSTAETVKKMESGSKTIWGMLVLAFGWMKNTLGGVLGTIKKGIMFLPLILKKTFTLLSKAIKWITGSKVFGFITANLGKIMKFIGRAAGVLFVAYEAISGYRAGKKKAREWHGVNANEATSTSQKVTAGIGGMLGGTGSGIEGAQAGAIKGGTVGFMVGGPIGAAIGVIAGALLGYVGGKNIAIGLQYIWDEVKNFVKGAYEFVKLPVTMAYRLAMRAKEWVEEKYDDARKWMGEKIQAVWDKIVAFAQPVIDYFNEPISIVQEYYNQAKKWMTEKIKGVTDFMSTVMNGLIDWISSPIKAIKNFLMGGPESMTKGLEAAREEQKKRHADEAGFWKKQQEAIPKYADGGIVPKTQLALVHEGEAVIPKKTVMDAAKRGVPPESIVSGAALADPASVLGNLVDSIKSAISPIGDFAKNLMTGESGLGGVKGAFNFVKGMMTGNVGPSSGFGWLSRMFESGGAGPGAISTGKGDAGGKSYGLYQFASNRGVVGDFIQKSGWASKFGTLKVGTPEFDAKWKEFAADPKFVQAQHDYVRSVYLTPMLNKIKADTGIDFNTRNPVLKEEALSTAIQYGPASNTISSALNGASPSITDADILKRIGNYKQQNIDKNFASSSDGVKKSVSSRINREISLAMMQLPGGLQQGVQGVMEQAGSALQSIGSGISSAFSSITGSFKGKSGTPEVLAAIPKWGADKLSELSKYANFTAGAHLENENAGFMNNFMGMAKEYYDKTKKKLNITDGFRSYEAQVAVKKAKPTLAATPGTSRHGYGVAIDASGAQLSEADSMGLLSKYGLVRPMWPGRPGGKREEWHVEPRSQAPTAHAGGFVERGGLVRLNPGEFVMKNMGQAQDLVQGAVVKGGEIANMRANEQLDNINAIKDTGRGIQKSNAAAMGNIAGGFSNVVNNISNSVQSSMATMGAGGGKKQESVFDSELESILSGNVA